MKIRHEAPTIKLTIAFRISLKSINDTLGADRLVPTLLVFGFIPGFPTFNSNLPGLCERMKGLQPGRKEIATITAETRIKRSLMSWVLRDTDIVLSSGYQVRLYWGTDRTYMGLFTVIRTDGKQVFVLQRYTKKSYSTPQIVASKDFELLNGDAQLEKLREAMIQFVTEQSRE